MGLSVEGLNVGMSKVRAIRRGEGFAFR